MTTLPIDGINFEFDDGWSVVKWDESGWFLDGICKLNGRVDERSEGTKAVDVVGLRDDVPYLFEVKDFRGVAIENKQRQLEELPLEVGLKARDTIAGLLGFVALDRQHDLPKRWIRAAQNPQHKIHVVALLAEDGARPGESAYKRDVRDSERSGRLKQRLSWLTPRVLIKDPLRDADSLHSIGVAATSTASSGPARPR